LGHNVLLGDGVPLQEKPKDGAVAVSESCGV